MNILATFLAAKYESYSMTQPIYDSLMQLTYSNWLENFNGFSCSLYSINQLVIAFRKCCCNCVLFFLDFNNFLCCLFVFNWKTKGLNSAVNKSQFESFQRFEYIKNAWVHMLKALGIMHILTTSGELPVFWSAIFRIWSAQISMENAYTPCNLTLFC